MMKVTAILLIVVCVIAPATFADYFGSSNVSLAIPDNQSAGITSTLDISSLASIADLDLVLNINHTSVPDLHIELTSPWGTTATLISAYTENGILADIGTPNNFTNTHLDDEAPVNMAAGSAPWTGHFNINHAGNDLLSVFDGQDTNGTWTLFVSDLSGQDVGTLQNWGLDINLTASESSPTVMSSDIPRAIPDNKSAGITSTLNFPSINIADLDLILNIEHTSVSDLHIELTSPSGITATLISAYTEDGIFTYLGTPDNFTDTHLDDEAPVNLADGSSPWTGHFNINHPGNDLLSIFDGEDAGGTWTLFVSDLSGQDVGTLQGWGLQIVPEPATLTLLGLGGVSLLRRRRRHK